MTRAEYEAEVDRPGPFEGARPWLPYFCERRSSAAVVYVGFVPEEEADPEEYVYVATVGAADAEMWPELRIGQKVAYMVLETAVVECSVPRRSVFLPEDH
jgi:hypothetical protein